MRASSNRMEAMLVLWQDHPRTGSAPRSGSWSAGTRRALHEARRMEATSQTMTRTQPSPATVAFMDIGTNSIRLLVVRIDANQSYTVLHQLKETVRLGEDEFAAS